MTKSKRIVIIDDEPTYRAKLAAKLKTSTLNCLDLAPPSDLDASAIVAARPDAVVVDYQLGQKQPGSTAKPAAYFGSLLVAAIRERLPAIPIVLVTRQKLVRTAQDFLAQAKDLDDAYDILIYKESIEADPAGLRATLLSLISGYATLKKCTSWPDVVEALDTPGYAVDELRHYGSPGGESLRPSGIARWIRRDILSYPGPLVDDLTAATEIGVSVAAFHTPPVAKMFSPAKYKGVFFEEHARWWRGELRSIAAQYSLKKAPSEQLSFAEAWNRARPRNQLEVSKCCVCGEATTEAVCNVLRAPVMLRHSLPYYPDRRPPGFDVARISSKAIKTKDIKDEHFSSNVLELVREIENADGP